MREFCFLFMAALTVFSLHPLVGVFLHQSKLHQGSFWSLQDDEAVKFTFKKSAKGLESI